MATTEKRITAKAFLSKAGTKAANSAAGFLQAYRDFLITGELAEVTSPILAKVDSRELMPTPGLELIKAAVLSHMIRIEAEKAEAKLLSPSEPASPKAWEVIVYNAKAQIQTRIDATGKVVDLQESFQLSQRAQEWADRRIVLDCSSDCFAVILHVPTGLETVVFRGDAFARMFPKAKAPFSKKTGVRDNRLSWGAKVQQSHAHFSHG